MAVILALPALFDAVIARFAAEAVTVTPGVVSALDDHTVGTSSPSVHAGAAPTGAMSVALRVVAGGTIGVAGITYEYSVDGGLTWSTAAALGTAAFVTIPGTGVRIDFSAGTLLAGDRVAFTTTAPVLRVVPNAFGWRRPAQRTGLSHRICWVPGKDGDVGKLEGARQPGRNPRPLATLQELFTVYIEAQDASAAEDELAQYKAARVLFDAWLRAVYLAARGTFTVESIGWVDDKKERRFGATLRIVCTVQAMVPDAALEIAPVDTTAEVTASVLDLDEQEAVP
jgi:hypothetical protein